MSTGLSEGVDRCLAVLLNIKKMYWEICGFRIYITLRWLQPL